LGHDYFVRYPDSLPLDLRGFRAGMVLAMTMIILLKRARLRLGQGRRRPFPEAARHGCR